jgi:UDP-N-acetyl-D-mannosaminuronate dehydrogenase
VPNHVVLGHLGEVGSTVYAFLKEVDPDVLGYDKKDGKKIPPWKTGLLHVCIPYSKDFVETVKVAAATLKAENVVIYSTVLPGTTELIGENAVHSPIEGRHPNLKESFKTFVRLVAGKQSEKVGQYFRNRDLKVEVLPDAKITELGKILSTTRYGVMLAFADTEQKLCDKFNVSFKDAVLMYQDMYNDGYKKMGEDRFTQPKLTPPNGKIGGHCVVNNAKILTEISDCDLIRRVAEHGK